MKRIIKMIAMVLSLVMVITMFVPMTEPVQAATIKLNYSKKTIYEGDTLKLKVKGTKQKVKWSSSNKKIASVNSNGVVTGKNEGVATITAKVSKKKLKCKVTVREESYVEDDEDSSRDEYTYDSLDKYEQMAVDGLTKLYPLLKDPSSLKINGISFGYSADFAQPMECVVIDYNAANSFGGSVRGFCMTWYSFTGDECFDYDCANSMNKYYKAADLDKEKICYVAQKYL